MGTKVEFVETKKKNYPPPQVWVIELKCESKILTTSGNGGGELPPNPNYPI